MQPNNTQCICTLITNDHNKKGIHSMNLSYRRLGLAVVLAQTAALAPAAHAQLEEIIVTAERRATALQETDIAITAFSEDTLQELGVTNYLDLADHAPNVMMHEMPGKAGGAIAIRGFKNAETISTFEPKVGLYLDGVIIAKGAGSVFDILDLERVEILRGPQGTLYGRNTAGGAVNFITKKPTYELGGEIEATFGKYKQRDIKGTLNLPLIENTLAAKATLASLNREGYWDNTVTGRDIGDKDREVAHIQLQWEPTDDLSVLYSYDMTDIDETQYPLRLVAVSEAREPQIGQYIERGRSSTFSLDTSPFMKADVNGHSVTVDWDINEGLSLVSITALRYFEVDNLQDSDHTPVAILTNASGDEIETFTQEVRLVGSAMDERLSYVLGGFYMDEDIKDVYTSLGIADFGIFSNSRAWGQNDVWAAFGEATYGLTDKLDFSFGLRYTEEDKTLDRTDTTVLMATGTPLPSLEFPEANETFEDVSGTLGFTYQWNPDVMTYAKISKGYISGGFNPRSPTTDFTFFTEGYDEETVINYEIGWKTTLLDNRLQLNGAVFYNDYKDLQVNQLTSSGRNNIDNAGDATIAGLELEAVAMLSENLEVGGSYGYLDPEYDTYIADAGTPNDPSDDVDLSNNHWAHAPENTFNAYARYVIPDFQSIGDLMFRLDYSWVDDHFLLTANSPDLVDGNTAPSYEFVNARMTLDKMNGPGATSARVSLWVRNLTDELWYTSGYDLTDGFLGIANKAPSPPRTWGVDISFAF